MSNNEKLRSEDIIEILDGKILTSEGHPLISVIPRENYNSVLSKISLQVLSPDQKLAFDSTLTLPSISNPVVLKNDITTYVPQADLGNIRDSVTTFSMLPVPFSAIGDTVSGSNKVTLTSTSGLVQRGDLIVSSGSQLSTNTLIVDVITANLIQILPSALATATGITFTVSPVEGDLRAVIADSIIYRWNGTVWTPFTRTGTLDHTELINQNGDVNYQHLTATQKSDLLSASHSHANKTVLDGILSSGSGNIITTIERNLLPSPAQKDALVGTSGTPSASNPYVTSLDTRLNTVRNPYVTIGPPGSLATFQGVDFRPFEDAILAIDVGTAQTVKAIEVLGGVYNLSGVAIIWNTQTSSLLLEGFTPQTATLSFQTRSPGIQAMLTGGPLIVRGFTFELNDQGTSGIISYRENTLIEDCIFRPGPTTSIDQIGIILHGTGSIVRNCQFQGQLTKGVEIRAANCRIENCTFNLSLPTKSAVDVYSDSAIIDHNFFTSGLVNVQSGVNFTNITNNRFALVTNTIVDAGTSTRYLENQPEDVNQPFIGRTRTVGPVGTYADYRGSNETPFLSALADPNVTTVEILEGTYTFAHTVTVPVGKSLRGVWQGLDVAGVTLQAADGMPVLSLSNWSRLENLQIQGSNTVLVSASSVSDMSIENCGFNLTAISASNQYELSLNSPTDCLIRSCKFKGIQGVYINGSIRTRLLSNLFLNTTSSLYMDTLAINEKDHVKDNKFITTTSPHIAGHYVLTENNHFLGQLPTKLNTLYSIWQGNWPHSSANNDTGVDSMAISLDRYLEASSDGVERSSIASTGSLSFTQNEIGIAATLPIYLDATKVDKTKPYSVSLYWTCADGLTGNVAWMVTCVWRDNVSGQLGMSSSQTVVSPRTQFVAINEDVAVFPSFTSYGISSDPTHVSFTVERLGNSPSDTLPGNAHLLEVSVLIPRD